VIGGDTTSRALDERVLATMAHTPVLGAADEGARRVLAGKGRLRHCDRGSFLFRQGDLPSEVFLLVEGRVEISSVSTNGHRQWHATLEPPELFGELAVLDGERRPAFARAVTSSLIWTAPGSALVEFLHGDCEASLALLRALARQVHASGSLVDDLLFLDLKGRVAKRLLGLVATSFTDLPPDGVAVPSVVTQADLASLAGGSRENVSRILSDLQRAGVVGRQGRRYVIRDVNGLSRLAGLPG
jgi:CRP-like cAMP-binding protein